MLSTAIAYLLAANLFRATPLPLPPPSLLIFTSKGNWKRPPKDPNAPPKAKRTPSKKSGAVGGDPAGSSPIKPAATTGISSATDNPPPILLNGSGLSAVKRELHDGSPIKVS